jgi:hypothetical protein
MVFVLSAASAMYSMHAKLVLIAPFVGVEHPCKFGAAGYLDLFLETPSWVI